MAGRVLIVDDNPTLRRVAAAMVERGGYTAVLAHDAEQAIEVLRDPGPLDAVLIDVVLPGADGVALGRQLRADPRHQKLALVLMSADAGRLTGAASALDPVVTLPKPFDGATLRATLDEAVRQSRPAPSARPPARPPTAVPVSSRSPSSSRPPPSSRLPPGSSRPPASAGRPASSPPASVPSASTPRPPASAPRPPSSPGRPPPPPARPPLPSRPVTETSPRPPAASDRPVTETSAQPPSPGRSPSSSRPPSVPAAPRPPSSSGRPPSSSATPRPPSVSAPPPSRASATVAGPPPDMTFEDVAPAAASAEATTLLPVVSLDALLASAEATPAASAEAPTVGGRWVAGPPRPGGEERATASAGPADSGPRPATSEPSPSAPLPGEARGGVAAPTEPPPAVARQPSSRPTLSSLASVVNPLGVPMLELEGLMQLTRDVLAQLGADGWFREAQLRQAVSAAMARAGGPSVVVPVEAAPPGPASVPPPSLGGPREVLRGQADAVPLGEVLQVLQMQMQSGQVQIHRGEGEEVSIHLRHGLVDLVTARGAADEFRMGRYLIEEGILDRDALGQGLEGSRASGRRLGDELIARGLINREQLEAALTRQSSELIYEVLRWTGARYVFVRGAASVSDVELGLPVASLVMEGFRRVDEWRLIEEQIEPATVLVRDEVSIDRLGPGRLGRLEKTLLDAVDGQRTVRDLLEVTSASSFEGSKILYQFVQSKLVRRRAA